MDAYQLIRLIGRELKRTGYRLKSPSLVQIVLVLGAVVKVHQQVDLAPAELRGATDIGNNPLSSKSLRK